MRQPSPERLDYEDGSFVYVFPDDLPLDRYREVQFYFDQIENEKNEFLSTVKIPIPQSIDQCVRQLDSLLYSLIEPYVQSISQILGIAAPELLTPKSRYFFFVHKIELGDQIEARSSGLNLLMGAEAYKEEEEEKSDPLESSGDNIWDIEVDLRLSFKHNADSIIKTRGIISCLGMLRQAARRMAAAQKEAEKSSKGGSSPLLEGNESNEPKIEEKVLDPKFAREEAGIVKALNLVLPEG